MYHEGIFAVGRRRDDETLWWWIKFGVASW